MKGLPIKKRILPALLCLASVVACLAYASFRSELPAWWKSHGGGIPYVIFWITLWHTLFPQRKYIVPICVGCVVFTCLLECLQAVPMPQPLEDFRRSRIGAAWLGYGFDASDIPPYVIGGVAGWLLLRLISRFAPEDDRSIADEVG